MEKQSCRKKEGGREGRVEKRERRYITERKQESDRETWRKSGRERGQSLTALKGQKSSFRERQRERKKHTHCRTFTLFHFA